jgi:ADP-dependent NAD(P)H-hydrate dehydratase / NAD(P)H-hydrate epimerase
MGALPDWCEPLLDAPRMRAVDRWAIDDQGIPSLDLMERAGEGVAREVERLAPDGLIVVVCGKGNNGGDGLVAARLLRDRGRSVTVVLTCSPGELSGDAAVNLERLPGEAPVAFGEPSAREAIAGAAIIVDALLGTGFSGEPRGVVAEAIEAIRGARSSAAHAAPARGARGSDTAAVSVVSVDVPSGVDADSGTVAAVAVHADATATFHLGKPGLWIHPGKLHAGEIVAIDIGIPRGAPLDTDTGLIGGSVLDLLPRRTARSSKFSSGHVVVVGGSPGLTGAPAMASLAAMRAGAGYVTACVPSSLRAILDVQLMEVMTRGLPDHEGVLQEAALEQALALLGRAGSLALGPGLGREDGAVALARRLAREAPVALVLDADGLNAHAGRIADLAGRSAATVLTPHATELGRLLGVTSEEVEQERLSHARRAAERSGSVVVLKGDDTLVADPDGRVAISGGASPALASAGTGDVLTGVIAALLAQGLDAFAAAAAAVRLHCEAARRAALEVGAAEGVIAADVIAALPRARARARSEGGGA